jgi:hypothetical protein
METAKHTPNDLSVGTIYKNLSDVGEFQNCTMLADEYADRIIVLDTDLGAFPPSEVVRRWNAYPDLLKELRTARSKLAEMEQQARDRGDAWMDIAAAVAEIDTEIARATA